LRPGTGAVPEGRDLGARPSSAAARRVGGAWGRGMKVAPGDGRGPRGA